MTKLSIIIPFFNEVDNACKLEADFYPAVQELFQNENLPAGHIEAIEIIFVDDGSKDKSLEEFNKITTKHTNSKLSSLFIKHPVNQGLGAALRSGFAAANGDIIVTTDVDGTYKFAEIPDLLAYLTPEVDIVTASPYHPDGQVVGVPVYRLLLSRSSSFIYQILVSKQIHTYTSLFRAYRSQVIKDIQFNSNGFLAGTELLVKAILKGYLVREYPAVLYRRAYGTSKAKLFKTVMAHLKFLFKISIHKLGFNSV